MALVALVVFVAVAAFVGGAVAAERRYSLPSYRRRWEEAVRVAEMQNEALEGADDSIRGLLEGDRLARVHEAGQQVAKARAEFQRMIDADWSATAAKRH